MDEPYIVRVHPVGADDIVQLTGNLFAICGCLHLIPDGQLETLESESAVKDILRRARTDEIQAYAGAPVVSILASEGDVMDDERGTGSGPEWRMTDLDDLLLECDFAAGMDFCGYEAERIHPCAKHAILHVGRQSKARIVDSRYIYWEPGEIDLSEISGVERLCRFAEQACDPAKDAVSGFCAYELTVDGDGEFHAAVRMWADMDEELCRALLERCIMFLAGSCAACKTDAYSWNRHVLFASLLAYRYASEWCCALVARFGRLAYEMFHIPTDDRYFFKAFAERAHADREPDADGLGEELMSILEIISGAGSMLAQLRVVYGNAQCLCRIASDEEILGAVDAVAGLDLPYSFFLAGAVPWLAGSVTGRNGVLGLNRDYMKPMSDGFVPGLTQMSADLYVSGNMPVIVREDVDCSDPDICSHVAGACMLSEGDLIGYIEPGDAGLAIGTMQVDGIRDGTSYGIAARMRDWPAVMIHSDFGKTFEHISGDLYFCRGAYLLMDPKTVDLTYRRAAESVLSACVDIVSATAGGQAETCFLPVVSASEDERRKLSLCAWPMDAFNAEICSAVYAHVFDGMAGTIGTVSDDGPDAAFAGIAMAYRWLSECFEHDATSISDRTERPFEPGFAPRNNLYTRYRSEMDRGRITLLTESMRKRTGISIRPEDLFVNFCRLADLRSDGVRRDCINAFRRILDAPEGEIREEAVNVLKAACDRADRVSGGGAIIGRVRSMPGKDLSELFLLREGFREACLAMAEDD